VSREGGIGREGSATSLKMLGDSACTPAVDPSRAAVTVMSVMSAVTADSASFSVCVCGLQPNPAATPAADAAGKDKAASGAKPDPKNVVHTTGGVGDDVSMREGPGSGQGGGGCGNLAAKVRGSGFWGFLCCMLCGRVCCVFGSSSGSSSTLRPQQQGHVWRYIRNNMHSAAVNTPPPPLTPFVLLCLLAADLPLHTLVCNHCVNTHHHQHTQTHNSCPQAASI
jgi:hypothetical protein